jgi:hypothetical protein
MLDVLEDGERLQPSLARFREIVGGVAGVAEVGEGVRFDPAVAEFPGYGERALIAVDGFGKVAEMVLGVAQAVPRMSLASAVTGFRADGE